jgi:hypothetical protein
MTRVQRLLIASIVVAVGSVALAAVRLATAPDDASTAPQRPRPAPQGAPAPPPVARPVRAAEVKLRQGVPAPGPVRIKARVGDEIRLTVSSSGAEDDVVVDGYGARAHVTPASPARLSFVATRTGFYDAVLQTSGAKVADLEIGG